MCSNDLHVGLMFRLHAVQNLKQSDKHFCSCCITNTRVKSITFIWVYGWAWQWQMQQWTCSGGFIKCFTTTFINPQSMHLSTHSQPHLYTFALNKVDEDNNIIDKFRLFNSKYRHMKVDISTFITRYFEL